MFQAKVKSYKRRTKSGKVVTVRGHSRKASLADDHNFDTRFARKYAKEDPEGYIKDKLAAKHGIDANSDKVDSLYKEHMKRIKERAKRKKAKSAGNNN